MGFRLLNPRHSLFFILLDPFSTLDTTDFFKPSPTLISMFLFIPGTLPTSLILLGLLFPVVLLYFQNLLTPRRCLNSYYMLLTSKPIFPSTYRRPSNSAAQRRAHYLSPKPAVANLLNGAKQPITQVRLSWNHLTPSHFLFTSNQSCSFYLFKIS